MDDEPGGWWLNRFGVDMGGRTGLRIGYAEVIRNDFGLLVTRKIFGKTSSLKPLVFSYRRSALMGEANTDAHNVRGIDDCIEAQG
jgi:hypothetical protein